MVQLSLHARRGAPEAASREHRVVVSGAPAGSGEAHQRWALLRIQDQRTLLPLLVIATLVLVLLAARDVLKRSDPGELAAPSGAGVYLARIAVNTCHWSELCVLPGVSTTLAKRIVAERDARGPFAHPPDLQRVPGIGPGKQSQLSGWLDFSCTRSPAGEGDTSVGRRLR